eukprot:GHVU01131768.1.p4 GENE.GHVU01131768.1~~GHVU01131768.1.p4  ORF type:complete len:118 (+),score=16.51 GHVU01131768.1:2352-2705(+)
MSLEDVQSVLDEENCYLCGRPDCSTVEREDCKKDHVRENVKLSCSPCNQFKGRKTVEQTKALAKQVSGYFTKERLDAMPQRRKEEERAVIQFGSRRSAQRRAPDSGKSDYFHIHAYL